jgi:phosphonatase-like hydrolase
MIELIVCDMAGTTVYDGDAVNVSFRGALAAAGVDADPALVDTVMGLAKPEAIRILLTKSGRSASDDQISPIHDDFVRRMLHYYATDPTVREIPGASGALAELRSAGVKVALNTGFSRPIVTTLLDRLGWRVPDTIDAVVCSNEVPHGRPAPDMIRALMKQLGLTDSRKIAKVGDTWADLDEGANAGCGINLGVTTGSFTREQLQTRPHTAILDSIRDVPAFLRSL